MNADKKRGCCHSNFSTVRRIASCLLTGATTRLKELAIDFPFSQMFAEIDENV
jgi:hypothetical protein